MCDASCFCMGVLVLVIDFDLILQTVKVQQIVAYVHIKAGTKVPAFIMFVIEC